MLHPVWRSQSGFWAIFLALLISLLGLARPAFALIHRYPEGGDRVMVRSLQTLRDSQEHAWQLVLFKHQQGGKTQSIYLRLVGFPEVVQLQHPGEIELATLRSAKRWRAPEVLSGTPSVPHIGEYDLMAVMGQIDTDSALRLTLPLQNAFEEIILPPYVIKEWRQLAFGDDSFTP